MKPLSLNMKRAFAGACIVAAGLLAQHAARARSCALANGKRAPRARIPRGAVAGDDAPERVS
ncbi:hypothetical protein CF641_38080 [Burkholderia pseudomallei]|nr:hypothetical protein CF641_38080 [Burkholderia pseudomallei]